MHSGRSAFSLSNWRCFGFAGPAVSMASVGEESILTSPICSSPGADAQFVGVLHSGEQEIDRELASPTDALPVALMMLA
jgi:hypothetical protein